MLRLLLPFMMVLATAAALQADPAAPVLPSAVNGFGFHALNQVASSTPSSNVCLSPLSLEIGLDMAYTGASGSTRSEMGTVLGVNGLTNAALGDEASDLMASLASPGTDITVNVADSLWIDSSTALVPAFVDRCKASYGADVATLNLRNPEAVARINKWVGDKTNGKIDHVLDRIDTDILSVLANALYFKAPWTTPFAVRRTTVKPFHVSDGGADISVGMMDRSGMFDYYEDADKQVVRLPFGQEGRFGFVVALPKSTDGLQSMVRSLDGPTWDTWLSQLGTRRGELSMPKFKVEDDISMNSTLKQMGMLRAFDSRRADFSQMAATPTKFFIGFVKHDTYLNVDEHGAEAAAATVIGMGSSAIMRNPPDAFTMTVDHPYLCAIVDSKTGVVLFAAMIYKPGSSPNI